jgi:hypothetical protein
MCNFFSLFSITLKYQNRAHFEKLIFDVFGKNVPKYKKENVRKN